MLAMKHPDLLGAVCALSSSCVAMKADLTSENLAWHSALATGKLFLPSNGLAKFFCNYCHRHGGGFDHQIRSTGPVRRPSLSPSRNNFWWRSPSYHWRGKPGFRITPAFYRRSAFEQEVRVGRDSLARVRPQKVQGFMAPI